MGTEEEVSQDQSLDSEEEMEYQIRRTTLRKQIEQNMEENHPAHVPHSNRLSGWAGISGAGILDKRIYGILLNKEGRENHHRLIGGATTASNISRNDISHLSQSPSNARGTFTGTVTRTERAPSQELDSNTDT